MRFSVAILLVGWALVALARESRPMRASHHDREEAPQPPSAHARLVTLPLPQESPSMPAAEELPPPAVDPTRAAVLALLEVVDDRTRDALLGYYVKAGFPTSELPRFSRAGGRLRLSDDETARFYVLARPGELLLVDPAATQVHNLHTEDINVAISPGRYDAHIEAPRVPGLYRCYCDVHGETLGWVLVTDDSR